MRHHVVFAIWVTAIAASSCWSEGDPFETGEADGFCPAPDCDDTVTIEIFRRDEEIYTPGTYVFSLEIDAGSPLLATCTLSDDASASCTADRGMAVHLNASFDRFVVRINDRAPEQLLISVSFNDGEIGAEILAPDYEYVGSSDPDCNLTCMQGTAEMSTISPTG